MGQMEYLKSVELMVNLTAINLSYVPYCCQGKILCIHIASNQVAIIKLIISFVLEIPFKHFFLENNL